MARTVSAACVCAACGQPIVEVSRGRGLFIAARGRIVSDEIYTHAGMCAQTYVATHPLPDGQVWIWSLLTQPARDRMLAAQIRQ
jgi:hypothetical protein